MDRPPYRCAAAASATLTCSPTSPGTYEITLTVTDQNDGHGISSANLTVNAALLGLPSVEGYGSSSLVVLVLVAFVVVLGKAAPQDVSCRDSIDR